MTVITRMLAMSAFCLSATFANTLSTHVDQLIVNAKKAQLQAEEIQTHLKTNQPDAAKIHAIVKEMEQHVVEVKSLISTLEGDASAMNEAQRAHLTDVKERATLMNIYLDQKRALLETADVRKSRSTLRAVVRNIAYHARGVQAAALRMNSGGA